MKVKIPCAYNGFLVSALIKNIIEDKTRGIDMFHSPNERYILRENYFFDPYKTGDNYSYITTGYNQFNKQFKQLIKDESEALDILLNAGYYEGSFFGRFYKGGNKDNRSEIYVEQPEIEERIRNSFIAPKGDMVKYLVGFTGVGKTTLIRNIFRTFERKTVICDNNLIIYISFYAMAENEYKEEKITVRDVLVAALENAINVVAGFPDYISRIETYDNKFYTDLYDFINSNNPTFLSSKTSSPEFARMISQFEDKKSGYLAYLANERPIEYCMLTLKYYLSKMREAYTNVIVILDDFENQVDEKQREVINYAYRMKNCMEANEDRQYSFKVLVSLRNYVYRNYKVKEVYREIDQNDLILKDKVPNLTEILQRRLNVIKKENPNESERYTSAYGQLKAVLERMGGQYDEILLNLTHYNIFACLKILLRILTNKQFIGKNETNNNGAFHIDAKKYTINTLPVFFAMAYGEEEFYQDKGNYYLTNILHYKRSDRVDNELMGLYVIKYMLKNGYFLKVLCFKEEMNVQCSTVINKMLMCFNNSSFEDEYIFKKSLMFTIKYMYEGGVLLESLYNPKYFNGSNNRRREFHEDMDIYLSLRGKQLFELLSTNSLLFEVYRDDIDSEIEGNTKLTVKMSPVERFNYCLNLIVHLFDVERALLDKVGDWRNYINCFGTSLAVSTLMEGLKKSFNGYFLEMTEDALSIIYKYNNLVDQINRFISNLEKINSIRLDYLDKI